MTTAWDTAMQIHTALSGRGLRRPAGDPLTAWMSAECDRAEAAAAAERSSRDAAYDAADQSVEAAYRAYRSAAARMGRLRTGTTAAARVAALDALSLARRERHQAQCLAHDYGVVRGVDSAVRMVRYYVSEAAHGASSYLGPLPISEDDRAHDVTTATDGEVCALRDLYSHRLPSRRGHDVVVVHGDTAPRRDVDDRIVVGSAWLAASRRLGAIACTVHEDCLAHPALACACAAGRVAA